MSARATSQPISLRAGGVERLNRAEVAGTIDDDGVARIDQAARQQIESLLRAGEHEHALGRNAETIRDRLAQRGCPSVGP